MNDAFISYSRRDKVFVQKLYDRLITANRTVWADWDSIPASSDWFAEIKQGIEETDSVIFILSPEWIKSNECRKEMDYAVKMGKRLFPILYLPVEPKDVPPELAKINWIYMRESDDFDKAFQTLCSALDTDLDWIKLHTRIQVRALEWEKKARSASFALRGEDLTEGEQFLASGANKNPVPTGLQSEYILASRKDATKRQRQTLAGVTAALVISVALAIVAAIQWRESVKQAQIALSRQLVAQAQSINFIRNSRQNVAALLSLQSLKLSSSIDAVNLLINNNFSAHPAKLLRYDVAVKHMALSPDGNYVAAAGDCFEPYTFENCTSIVVIWEITEGRRNVQLSHHGAVSSIAFSPDSKYLISGSADDTARLWEVESGKEILSMPHQADVTATAFSPDGQYVLSGDAEGRVSAWKITSGKQVLHLTLEGESPRASSIAFSPDGKYIAAAGTCDEYDSLGYCTKGLAGIWAFATKDEIARVTHDGFISAIAFSSNSEYLLTGSDDNTTRLWKIPDGTEAARFKTNGLINSLTFSSNGKYILVASADGVARVWDIATREELSHMAHDSSVTSAVFSPDEKLVLSGSEDGTARVWNVSNGEEVARMTHDRGDSFSSVYSVGFSPDGRYAFSGGADKTIRIWDATSVDRAVFIDNHKPNIEIFISPNGRYAFSRNNDDHFCVWDVSDGRQINCTIHDMIYAQIFSTDGKQMLSASLDGLFRIWDVANGTETILENQNSFLAEAAFSPDGKFVVAGTNDQACVWESSTGQEIKCISLSDSSFLRTLGFDPDNKTILSGTSDGQLCVWEFSSGKQVRCITHDTSVQEAEFGTAGKYVFFHDDNQNACSWEISSEQITCLHINHDDLITSVRFGRDGHYVASASWDGSVRIWNFGSGEEIARKIHGGPVHSVTFSPDAKYVISASGDGIVRQWLWHKDDIVENACARVTRNLTRSEWEEFVGDAMEFEAVCDKLPIEPEAAVTSTATP